MNMNRYDITPAVSTLEEEERLYLQRGEAYLRGTGGLHLFAINAREKSKRLNLL